MSDVEFEQHSEGPTGWTPETIWPLMHRPYHMACCDCGLVHDIEFSVFKKAKGRDFGGFRPVRVGASAGPLIYAKRDRAIISSRAVQISMRVRRNYILTAEQRKPSP